MRSGSVRLRWAIAAIAVGLLVAGCGGTDLTLSEYVDRLNAINDRTVPQAEVFILAMEQSTTPAEVGTAMQQMANLRIESVEETEKVEPPEQVAEFHQLLLDWERSLVPIEEAFAARANTVSGWPELLESPEVDAYRVALGEGKQVCVEFQERLDATVQRGVFEDTPWIPRELGEVVEARLGCDLFPENPDEIFRPAPADG